MFGLAEISRNSDGLKAEQHPESFSLSWWDGEKRVLILPILTLEATGSSAGETSALIVSLYG